MFNIYITLGKAQEVLSTDSYDVVHDFNHHYSVLQNVFEIVTAENLKVDIESLAYATMFHDYETYYKEEDKHKKLKSIFSEFEKDAINKIVKIIDEHSLKSEQNTIESKVLFDADKLEGISILRWKYTMDAYKSNLIEKSRLRKYIDLMNNNYIQTVEKRLFFNYTKGRFPDKRDLFLKWVKNNGFMIDDVFTIPDK